MTVYAFNDVEFTNGQIVNEGDMDQVSENIQYVREELRTRVLAAVPVWAIKSTLGGVGTIEIRWQLIANASTVLASSPASAATSAVNLTGLVNVSLSALTLDADHTLRLHPQIRRSAGAWNDAAAFDVGPFVFVRTPDVAYATVNGLTHYLPRAAGNSLQTDWGAHYEDDGGSDQYAVLRNATFLLHRDSEF